MGAKAALKTCEEELEERVHELEAQVAYLKISIALKAELRPEPGEGLSGHRAFRAGIQDVRPARSRRADEVELPLRTGAHQAPDHAGLRARVAEIFGRLPNGVGYRQIAMELRAVDGERIADKTALKVMNEMCLRCGIRRKTDHHRYNSHRGEVGSTFENTLGRDSAADGPWPKMGTDVTEFGLSFGKAYLAPVYDFGSKEIVAHSISPHPDLAQQEEMPSMLMAAKPEEARPILYSDMGVAAPARGIRQDSRGERLDPEHA